MDDSSLAAAYPTRRRGLGFFSGSFSPDGTLFAVVVEGIKSGDAEQVWLYEIRSRKLVSITEQPQEKPDTYIDFKHLVWGDDGTLYLSAKRFHGVARQFFVAATVNQVTKIDSVPAPIAAAFEQHNGGKRSKRYTVEATNYGHGNFLLEVHPAKGGSPRQIATGSWELESFLFSSDRSEVLYPTMEGIVAVELASGKSRFVLRASDGNRRLGDLLLLDRTRDGRLIAYTVYGPCIGKPDYSGRVPPPRNVCFAEVK